MLKCLVVLCILLVASEVKGAPQWNKYQRYLENPSVDRFREYLRIDTSKEEYINRAVEFWVRQATEVGLPYSIYQPAGKPIFVATLAGSDPSLPSIMLNSHMDVVPVDEAAWTYPPFEAYMDQNGDIYARGAQDAKDVGMQYMEAIRKIKKGNMTLLRTVHITAMPDEETGSKKGMQAFVKTKEFKALNIGFALDEGLPSTDDSLYATFLDRRPWQMRIIVHGVGGHGFAMPDESALEKAYRLVNAVMSYRDSQKAIMKTKGTYDYTGYNSLNINVIKGGIAVNIIPSSMELAIDMRLAPDANPVEVEALVNSWLREAGNCTEITFLRHENASAVTPVDSSNPYWTTMRDTLNNMGIRVTPIMLAATSDMLFLRNLGFSALGFAAKSNTIGRFHTEDEYLNVETFLKGIDIYTKLIPSLANVPSQSSKFLEEYLSKRDCKH